MKYLITLLAVLSFNSFAEETDYQALGQLTALNMMCTTATTETVNAKFTEALAMNGDTISVLPKQVKPLTQQYYQAYTAVLQSLHAYDRIMLCNGIAVERGYAYV